MESEIYWSPFSDSAAAEVARLDEAGAEARLIDLLRQSIGKRMMADVPFGVFLSGGVDSSTNVALMSELMTDPVRTFSVAFADYPQYNELEHARRIAELYATDHHEVVIGPNDLADDVEITIDGVCETGAASRTDENVDLPPTRRVGVRRGGSHRPRPRG